MNTNELTEFASDIIFESDLLKDTPIESVPDMVDVAIQFDCLSVSKEERQYIIDEVVRLLPIQGWGE